MKQMLTLKELFKITGNILLNLPTGAIVVK